MYLYGFVPSCRRSFAEGRISVEDHSCPPDFGGANFSVPWTTGKADFAGQLNFFTASSPGGEIGQLAWNLYLRVSAKICVPINLKEDKENKNGASFFFKFRVSKFEFNSVMSKVL